MNQLTSLRILRRLIVIIGLFSTIALSESTKIPTSPITGTIWNGFVELEKKAEAANDHEDAYMVRSIREYYVMGFYAGFHYCDSQTLPVKLNTQTSVGHVVRGVDQFYQDYRNENLTLLQALVIVSMEINGENKDRIEAELRLMRKLATYE